MKWLLLLLLILPGDVGYTKHHRSKALCREVAAIYEDAVDHGVITRKEKNRLLRRCYKHAHE
jgi:hypothetical protein